MTPFIIGKIPGRGNRHLEGIEPYLNVVILLLDLEHLRLFIKLEN